MAEFQKVMNQWKRMCRYYTQKAGSAGDACAICKFEGNGSNCLAIYEDYETDTEEVERVVMSWAAEHPEPVYPTWEEWLEKQGVLDYIWDYNPVTKHIDRFLNSKAKKPIPADIAEKLGIEPKEV